MPKCWRLLPFLAFATSVFAASQSFENTAIVRTVELGGAVVHVTTTYAIKSLEDGLKAYTIALGRDEKAKTSYLEAKVKGQQNALQIREHALDTKEYAKVLCHYVVVN